MHISEKPNPPVGVVPREAARPSAEAIHQALKRLCTKGVQRYWIKDYCSELLMLRGVEQRLQSPNPTRDESVDALVRYLSDLVERTGRDEYRVVLRIVLALDKEFLETTATDRRKAAGERFRDGSAPVQAGTIRQYHEVKAIEKLHALILVDEGLRPELP